MENTLNKIVLTGVIAMAAMTGCADKHGERFTDDTKPTYVGEITQAQSAAGAKQDAMLYDMNFDGSNLNSLGQGKLDLICKGTAIGSTPVVVYLNMPQDQVALREPVVAAYLKTGGLTDTQFTLIAGANPNTSTPSAYNLGGIYKADGTSFDGEAAVPVPTAGASK